METKNNDQYKQQVQQVQQFNDGYHPDTDNSNDTNKQAGSNTVKDPDDWTTGDEPMTGAQASYLKTLSDEAGEPFVENLSKAEASKRINELQQITGRGLDKKS